MRIAIDARFLGAANSALARYSESLLQALTDLDTENEYTVIVSDRLMRKLKLGENFSILPMKGKPLTFAGMRRLRRLLKRESFDLLHVHYPLIPPGVNTPTVITAHDTIPFTRESQVLGIQRGPVHWLRSYLLYPFSLRRAKWIVCVSHSTREQLGELFPGTFHKSIVIHSGINEPFKKDPDARASFMIRENLGLPAEYLLYSGAVRADKNIEGMIRSFSKLVNESPVAKDLAFVIDTPGELGLSETHNIIDRYRLKDRVRILTGLDETGRRVVFEHARAFFMLCPQEGFGFPILEAQLCGLPVLASNSGALPEVAGEDGAVYVNHEDTDEVTGMLDRVLGDENLRSYLRDQGMANAEKYHWHSTAGQLLNIYNLLFYPRDLIRYPTDRKTIVKIWEWIQH
jgi:glycosyltransferase involved in cell wall biosynthesis